MHTENNQGIPLQSIMEYNGAAIVAMIGKECVAIAADRRLGIQAQTVATNFQKIFQMNDTLFVGLPGLATDVQTVWVTYYARYSQEEGRIGYLRTQACMHTCTCCTSVRIGCLNNVFQLHVIESILHKVIYKILLYTWVPLYVPGMTILSYKCNRQCRYTCRFCVDGASGLDR